MSANRLPLTIGMSHYDHVASLINGEVEIAGVAPNWVELPIPESFRRFINTQDWDVAEMSSTQYITRRMQGDDRIIGLPIFTSRVFRHSCIYVRKDRISKPEDLRGARVGTTEWILSANIYARGLLSDMYGIQPGEMQWIQAGMDRPGRANAVMPPHMPPGVDLICEPEKTLQDMLWNGEIDAVMAPQYPAGFRAAVESSDLVGRLFDDVEQAERDYFAKTRTFPIMHMMGIRRDIHEQNRWLASNLYRAFEVAKRRYFAKAEDIAASRLPIPWITSHLAQLHETFGPDLWPYGVEANRPALETFVRYAREQGLIEDVELDPADLFAPIEPFVDGM